MESNQFGKKIFFLYPHSVIQTDLIHTFIANEYEVYTLKDYLKVKQVLKKHKNSILFINIDDVLKEDQWFDYVKSIVNNEDFKDVQVGILTYNENEELARKYLIDITVPCGFIQLKLGRDESSKIILKTLAVNNGKGKRKYVRATSSNHTKATFNVTIGADLSTGHINDISSVGMSVVFDNDIGFKKNALLRNMQLKLNGKLVLLDTIVFGSRDIEDNKRLYVLMFTNEMLEDSKYKIHEYIRMTLQANLDKEIYG